MLMVNTHEAKTQLSGLLAKIERGEEIVYICRGGKPIARLLPLVKKVSDPLSPNPDLKPLAIKEDLCAPLDEKDWPSAWR